MGNKIINWNPYKKETIDHKKSWQINGRKKPLKNGNRVEANKSIALGKNALIV